MGTLLESKTKKNCSHCGRANSSNFRQCDVCRISHRKSASKYDHSEKGRVSMRKRCSKYNHTEKGRIRNRKLRYKTSLKLRERGLGRLRGLALFERSTGLKLS